MVLVTMVHKTDLSIVTKRLPSCWVGRIKNKRNTERIQVDLKISFWNRLVTQISEHTQGQTSADKYKIVKYRTKSLHLAATTNTSQPDLITGSSFFKYKVFICGFTP